MADFDDRWLDLDFDKQPEFTFGDLGAPDEGLFGSYEDKYGVLSDAEIREAVEKADAEGGMMEGLTTRTHNQKQEGSCTCNALGLLHEIIQCEQSGDDSVIDVSPISLYKRVARSASSGSNIGEAAGELKSRGILPLDNAENKARFDHTMPHTGFSTPFPKGWEETAIKLAIDEYTVVKTPEGFRSALVRRDPCVGGRDGHAICYVRLMWENGRWVYKYKNSWGKWGDVFGVDDYGYGYDSESKGVAASRYIVVGRTSRLILPKSLAV